jgi:lantibiotic transport system permease protein
MREFYQITLAEILKLRRSLVLRLAVAAPLVIVLLQFGVYLARGEEMSPHGANPLTGYAQSILTLWTIVLFPFYAALVAALLADIENRGGNWERLLSLPVSRRSVYAAKWVSGGLLLLISSAVLSVGVGLSATILRLIRPNWHSAAIPISKMLAGSALSLCAISLLFSIQMWISLRWKSFMIGLAVSIVGIVINIILLPRGVLFIDSLYPWAMPAIEIAPTSPFRLLGLVWGLAGGVAVGFLACSFMARSEQR